MIKGINAIILIVKDINKQKNFYRDVMGFEVEADYGNEVFFRIGDQKLALFAHGAHPEGDKRLEGAKKGISHLEFSIDKKNRDAFEKRLKEEGHHAYGNCFEDSDGNLFHFSS